MGIDLSKKKILILVNHDVVIYNFRKEVVEELIRQGYEVLISSPYGEKIDKLIGMGCKYSEVTFQRHGLNILQEFKLLSYYIKLIKAFKPTVVLTFTIKPNIYGGIASQINDTPYISNITGLGSSINNGGVLQKIALFLYRHGLKKANIIFFQNQSNYKTFEKFGLINNNGKIIPGSGVNLNEYSLEDYPDDKQKINFLFIGRIMKDKGIDELLDASKIINYRYNDVKFNLIGFSEENYTDRIKTLESNGYLKYHGQQSDVHSYIKKAHAVVLPSYHEGMANVLLEGLATGRPVIASNIPGCRETFDENISGFGVQPKDVSSLVNALDKFINLSYEKKRTMGLSGRKKVEDSFNRNIVVNAYITEIDSIVEDENEFIRENS